VYSFNSDGQHIVKFRGGLRFVTDTRYDPLLLQVSSQGPPVSAVVYAAADRWAQHRSSGAVVTV